MSGFGNIKRRSRPKTITEEERLGLVHVGSDAVQQDDDDDDDDGVSPAVVDERGRREFSAGGESVVTRGAAARPGGMGWRTDSEDEADEDEFGLARRFAGNETGYARIQPPRSNFAARPRSMGAQQGAPAESGGQRGSRGRYGRDEDDEDDLGGRAFV